MSTPREQENAALLAARAQGCTCNVEVVASGAELQLQHDSWCPLLRVMEERPPNARRQLVIAPRRKGD